MRQMMRSKKLNDGIVRILCLYLAAAVLLGAWYLTGDRAAAYDEVKEISVTVGYWGGKEYTKQTVSLDELADACGTNRAVYTWINGGESPGTTEAEGIYIADIMDYCGVDMGSVYYYNFATRDAATYANSDQQWTGGQLFGTRYTYVNSFQRALKDYEEAKQAGKEEDYLRNPEKHYTIDDIYDYQNRCYTKGAWNKRETVEPMLALRTRSSTWKGYVPAASLDFDETSMLSTGKPILLFGQAGRNDITRNLMAQMVTKVHIWFNGSPSITLSKQSIKGKVGSSDAVSVKVSTPDEYLSGQIQKEIRFKSSDAAKATVDEDGNVKITGKGEATISAIYQGKTVGTVSVSGTAAKKQAKKEKNAGSGTGSGHSSGSGNGAGSSGAGTAGGVSDSNSGGLSDSGSRRISMAASKSGSADKSGGSAEGGKVYEISKDADTLENRASDRKSLRWCLLAAAVAMIGGGTWQTAVYRRQIHWIKQAKKAYEEL